MNLSLRLLLMAALVFLSALSATAQPAVVGPGGYTNSFASRPGASEWSTFSFAGAGGNNYNIVSDVQTLTAATINLQVVDGSPGDPPNINSLGQWTSGGGTYLTTRPTANRFSVLMVSLFNASGSNVTSIRLSYDFSIKAPANEPDLPGHRAFYSLTGAAGSWVAIPEFSSAAPAAGLLMADITFAAPWNQSNFVYVIWADDNANSFTPDPGYAIDNFSATITGGSSVRPPVTATLTAPTNNAPFFGAATITLMASAAAPEHTVTNVAFFVDGVKLGDDAVSAYSFDWNNPPLGPHILQAVASDELGVTGQSAMVNVFIYDAMGSPFARITAPTNGFVAEGPTNLLVSAYAVDAEAVTNVEFYANGTLLGSDDTVPHSVSWNAPFGSNALSAVAVDLNGLRGTSAVVTVRITIPPTNTTPPRVSTQAPLAGTTVITLTNISVTFTERVQGVDAADLLVQGSPATQVVASPGGSNYVFSFPQPAYGEIDIYWAANHGITDFGFPSNLPFDGTGFGARWSYSLIDQTPPTIAGRVPAAGTTVSNLSQVAVLFSETVIGVDAADFLVNGTPALSVIGGGSNYTFHFTQPPAGPVNISWSAGHGIADTAANAFNAGGPGATWNYTLDLRVPLVQSNSTWRFVKGLAEASSPIDAWRHRTFDDAGWSNALAPFFFGDPYNSAANPGTLLSDMQGAYTSIYLRSRFNLTGASAITNLFFTFQADDGFIAWINGTEVLRYNMPGGEVPYNGVASTTAQEPTQSGAAYILSNLVNTAAYLLDGENVLAVHAFNQSIAQSTDFGFNAQLSAIVPDPSVVPPGIAAVTPSPGSVFYLTNITVRFTEGVSGVDAADLLVNGLPAANVSSATNTTYTFDFPQPSFGLVTVTWASGHGIADFDSPPKSFNAAGPGGTFNYSLVNPSAPTVAAQSPLAGATINALTQLTVSFSEAVTGVDAADLRVNGAPATGISGGPVNYTFTFAQPAYGMVSIGWDTDGGITDVEPDHNEFDGTRAGNTWTYTLVDQTPPVIASITPTPGSQVTNLTQVTVRFSESVAGVNASDLRVNGVAATGLSGSGAIYTFTFPQPNATLLNFGWANAHGIRDLAPVPNSFDATAAGATWSYTTPDTLSPAVAEVSPAPFVTVRSLTQIRVTFTEPVTGVDTNDLLVNGARTLAVNGSGVGPYTFSFLPPPNGTVNISWAANNGIRDLARPLPNPFAGGEWSYLLDPTATFAGKVIINEIMFNPTGGQPADEWIEVRNVTGSAVNLAGWRFSRGVNFTFPNVSLPPQGHLVVAASLAGFQARFPDVTNVIGGWTGSLANSDETIELETAQGESVNSVHYATAGDWARRERGHGAELVESITRNGNTATVRIFNHGYTSGGGFGGGTPDVVLISGADQPEYNGLFTVANAAGSTFNITVPGAPVSPATGHIICRHAVDEGMSGWSWFSPADGFGFSLELVNAALGNASGQNWRASTNSGGTPGRANSVAAPNIAPLIEDLTHFPPIPKSTDPITITARVRDEFSNGVAGVTLFYRHHTGGAPAGFSSTNMFDDGGHGDGLERDGLFAAILPAEPNGTVIEFYVQAADTNGLSRTWPAPTWETNNTFAQLANALCQVDDEAISNPMPAMRVVMSGTERAVFPPANRNSDAEMNATFVSTDGEGTKVRYLCGVRVRGAGSRTRTPPNNRVNIPNDNRWNGLSAINLNGQFVHAQVMGAAVARKTGVPAAPAHVVQYRINGANPAPLTAPFNGGNNGAGYGAFLMILPVNGDLMETLYPEDGDGNVYRASTGTHAAQFVSRGTNPDLYLADGYFKTSNQTENDWSDMVALTAAFSLAGSDADYLEAMSTNVNVEIWMRYFALGTLINYGETSLFNGRGDDYALYRGLNDPRFVPIGHDFDTVFGQGDTITTYYPVLTNSSLFIMMNPPNTGGGGFGGNPPNIIALRRFMTNEVFAPIFFREVKRLCDTVFSPAQLNPLFDQLLSNWGNGPTAATIAEMKAFAQNRCSVARSQIPLTLTVGHTLGTSNGFAYATTASLTLFGQSHAIETRRVLVNGTIAARSPWEARWTNTVTLQPGINRLIVQSLDSNLVEFARVTLDVWYDTGARTAVSGAIATDAVWSAAGGPYQVTANLTVGSGATLTIQPGTTVFLNPGVNFTVANGGRLLAEGTDAGAGASGRIRFSAVPGGGNWGGFTINGGANSPETRMAYAHFEGNNNTAIEVADGTVFLDHLTFGNTARQYLSLDRASFVVQNCVFPAVTEGFEPVHGTGGIKAGGRGIVRRCFWGRVTGYNDAFDFTGGNRPGPILQVLNCVFVGSDDDLLDFDSTDAWVEGNIFLHCHRNAGSPDSSSAVSGGSDNADNSQITMIGNLFYDCDQAANAKQTNFYTMLNNTIVRQSRVGSIDTNAGVVILADDNSSQGRGILLEGNIIADAENLTRNVTTALVTYTNNLIWQLAGAPWSGPGGGNINADPLFKHVPQLSETTNFNSWAEAQVLWDWFSLQPGSPAIGAGANGRDLGAVGSRPTFAAVASPSLLRGEKVGVRGASLSGEPVGTTPLSNATLRVDPVRTGQGISVNGFPNGSGFTHYRWRLDGGAWSAETPTANPISLTGLSPGPHYVEVSGRNDAGFYQDDSILDADAVITVSRTWTVDPTASALRLNEILASNVDAVNHNGTRPDVIEIYNTGDTPISLAGYRLTDDASAPDKFIFPVGAGIAGRSHLVVYADNPNGTPGYHLGFNLNQGGDSLYLFAPVSGGGALLDSVSFGLQLADLSIGRLGDGAWALTRPTFGGANRAARTGDHHALRINEWLALASTPPDFVELLNMDSLPVALGGLYISDEPLGWPGRHPFAPLSFIGGNAYLALRADGDPSAGADHVNFTLNGAPGAIGLFDSRLTVIDCVWYQPQQPNVSQGRSPNGTGPLAFLSTPTPGSPNPLVTGPVPFGGALVINEVLAANSSLVEAGLTPDWIELYNGTTNLVNLGGLSLTDDPSEPGKFVFSYSTSMAPGGFVRVTCDPGGTDGLTHTTNFALSSTGGGVYLYDSPTNGGTLLSSIVYGIQTPDLSIGRVPDGGENWTLTAPSPGQANFALPLGNAQNLRINEWMADPSGGDDWFEIYNPNNVPVALGPLALTDDLSDRLLHRIAPLSFIGNGSNAFLRIHADGNTGAGADHTGFSLSRQGEAIGISFTNSGALIDGVTFGQQILGVSEGRFPDGGMNVVGFAGTASPGASNWRLLTDIVINEVLTHTDEPLEDAIELRNLSAQPVDVGGWWLSDDTGILQKYQIPGPRMIPAFGFTVIYENQFTNREIAAVPFALSSRGDEVVLSAYAGNALTGYRAKVDFGAADNGTSFGYYLTSDGRGEFVAMSARSFGVDDPGTVSEFRDGTGRTNAYPRVGPVVISEIMYHPPDIGLNDNVTDEFIELRNITTAPVPLYDPAFPAHVWHLRDAVDFNFPPGTVIAPGDYLLVVSFDPVNNTNALGAFRTRYGLALSTPIVGPYSGRLANDSNDIELRKPGEPDTNGVSYILVERVRYSDTAPWPNQADGTGFSLQRVNETEFGDDPINWTAASPTAGPTSFPQDSDNDGLPDSWELANGFDRFNWLDASLDTDGDGLTNVQEYQMGTDPRDAQSGMRITSITRTANGVVITFTAFANQSYTLEFTDALGSGWQPFQDVAAAAATQTMEITVPATGATRFFRLRSPWRFEAAPLRIDSLEREPGNQLALAFTVPAHISLAVEHKITLDSGPWTTLTNFFSVETNRVLRLPLEAANASGFYRLRSP